MTDQSRSATSGAAPMIMSGWRDAGLFVWAIAALTILYAIGLEHGAHPVPTVLVAMLVTSVVLIAAGGGPGPGALRIMLAPQSFLVGFGTIGLEAFYVLMMLHVTPAEAALLMRIAIPLALGVGWLLLDRRPGLLAVLGALILVAGLGRLIEGIDAAERGPGVLYAVASALCFVTRSYASELHPWNRTATSVRERVRVTGLVVLSTTLLALAATALLLLARGYRLLPPTPMLPEPEQFLHIPTLLVALVIGGFVLTSMYFLSFAAVVKIRAENFIAVTVLTPATTLVLQVLAVNAGLLGPQPIAPHVLAAMAVIIAGAGLIVLDARRRRHSARG